MALLYIVQETDISMKWIISDLHLALRLSRSPELLGPSSFNDDARLAYSFTLNILKYSSPSTDQSL